MPKNLNIVNCGKNWIKFAANNIKKNLPKKTENTYIILAGGRYAKQIYSNKVFKKIIYNKQVILADERLTNVTKSKNKTLIKRELNAKSIIEPSELNNKNKYNVAFCLLSLGEDGHFASIFPNDKTTIFSKKKYFEFTKKKHKFFKRMTISLSFLLKIKKIYILVNGEKKSLKLNQIIQHNYNHKTFSKNLIIKFPLLKILSKSIFLLDYKAFNKIIKI